tara:strand:- start:1035 stop:1667 length:633 start_codon:yes stop_codon:yes gene_type:complete
MSKIIFVDDDENIRATFKDSIELMFDDEYEAICLDVEPSLREMMSTLDSFDDKVAYFIDEKLSHGGRANYSGIDIIEEIRKIDSKIPIYILTSTASAIEQYLGNIEFVIDKNDWESSEEENNLKQRFLRHIHTYKDIKSKKALRFDELFEKSLFSSLTAEEYEEFRILNVDRSKKLVDESLISEASLDNLNFASKELDEIYKELSEDGDE